eukprot:4234485-Amphidinium_carterae.1
MASAQANYTNQNQQPPQQQRRNLICLWLLDSGGGPNWSCFVPGFTSAFLYLVLPSPEGQTRWSLRMQFEPFLGSRAKARGSCKPFWIILRQAVSHVKYI